LFVLWFRHTYKDARAIIPNAPKALLGIREEDPLRKRPSMISDFRGEGGVKNDPKKVEFLMSLDNKRSR
jgi:hypothetical protein